MISVEKKAELDQAAKERSSMLGKSHVTDGDQFYHAGQRTPDDHVAGNTVLPVAPAAPAPAKAVLPVAPSNPVVPTPEKANG